MGRDCGRRPSDGTAVLVPACTAVLSFGRQPQSRPRQMLSTAARLPRTTLRRAPADRDRRGGPGWGYTVGRPFPNFEGKHAHDAFFSPREAIGYLQRRGVWVNLPPLAGVIFLYSRRLQERMLARWPHEQVEGFPLPGTFHVLAHSDARVGLGAGFGIGAPAAASLMEELIAAGVGRFVSIGAAGGLQLDLRIGDLVVCDRAIRDEGVSHHYLAPATYAVLTAALTERLRRELSRRGSALRVGTTWTTDTPYRETVEELRRYQAEGVLTVEMEAAALAAVARYRGVEFATAFAVSDSLAELVWNPQFSAD